MAQRAILIGVDDYGGELAPLSSCVLDAVAMRDELLARNVFAAGECTLMTSPVRADSTLPTTAAILDALLPVYTGAPLDRLLVYFAGHGLSIKLLRGRDTLQNAIVTAGARSLRNAGAFMIDTDELVERFARRGAKEQFWLFDCCRNLPPDSVVPNVPGIGWDIQKLGAFEMKRSVLYAVSALGRAPAIVGSHGVLTGHVLDALRSAGDAAWGAAAMFVPHTNSWVLTLDSIRDYAVAQIEATAALGGDPYRFPTCWHGENRAGALLDIGKLGKRPFTVTVTPEAARQAVKLTLSERGEDLDWPPMPIGEPVPMKLDVFHVSASGPGWEWPALASTIDIRRSGTLALAVAPAAAADPTGLVPDAPSLEVRRGPVLESLVTSPTATVTVHAIDPGATVRMTKLSAAREDRVGAPGKPIAITPGVWRTEVLLGTDVLGVHVADYAAGASESIDLNALVSPALKVLVPAARRQAGQLQPSESIGPMQGAVLPTLLPLVAIKPFDTADVVLRGLSPGLGIPKAGVNVATAACVAIAIDGEWPGDRRPPASETTGELSQWWNDPSDRIAVLIAPQGRWSSALRVEVPGFGALEIPAPCITGYCTAIGLTVRPDASYDVSIGLFGLPFSPDDGRHARARALASQLYGATTTIDAIDTLDTWAMISAGSYGDPILGALAWFGRNRWSKAADPAQLAAKQRLVSDYLPRVVPRLTDARVIQALSSPAPEAELDALLRDPALDPPVMTEALRVLAARAMAIGDASHWTVARYQRVPTGSVFDVIKT